VISTIPRYVGLVSHIFMFHFSIILQIMPMYSERLQSLMLYDFEFVCSLKPTSDVIININLINSSQITLHGLLYDEACSWRHIKNSYPLLE
jgi:hypothetical protein